jgi:hypothetical protein
LVRGKYGFLDDFGKMAISPRYTDVSGIFCHPNTRVIGRQPFGRVKLGGTWRCIDTNGKRCKCTDRPTPRSYPSRMKPYRAAGGRWGFTGPDLKIPAKYNAVGPFSFFYYKRDNRFSKTLAAIRVGRRWGFIDERGKVVIRPRYDDARRFCAPGVAAVKTGGKWGFVDHTGKMAVPPTFVDVFVPPKRAVGCHFGALEPARVGKKWGYIDLQGNWVIKPKFHTAQRFLRYRAMVGVCANARCTRVRCGYINPTGRMVWDPAKSDPTRRCPDSVW